MTAHHFLLQVQQFFPQAGLRTAGPRMYAAYCRDRQAYICYDVETRRWLVETANDYLFDDDLANAVSRMTSPIAL
ncbi:hypothetical protein [Synechococcus elongatus]|uniref:Uncharacterized protein n=1 Tax=Synechococcus elongatus PCC 11801 TaxID=2219813 RepID=A0AAN1QPR3_SYNEL|nr:hypothetical protein [Synechococcus elongatus]AZB73175.1 hypothetical protein DOP62_11030 [Synechococcus elongatus PCC 11801]